MCGQIAKFEFSRDDFIATQHTNMYKSIALVMIVMVVALAALVLSNICPSRPIVRVRDGIERTK